MRIPQRAFNESMRKKMNRGYSKQAAFNSTMGWVRSMNKHQPRNALDKGAEEMRIWLIVLTAILVTLALLGVKAWISNWFIKVITGIVLGIPSSAIAAYIVDSFGGQVLEKIWFKSKVLVF